MLRTPESNERFKVMGVHRYVAGGSCGAVIASYGGHPGSGRDARYAHKRVGHPEAVSKITESSFFARRIVSENHHTRHTRTNLPPPLSHAPGPIRASDSSSGLRQNVATCRC